MSNDSKYSIHIYWFSETQEFIAVSAEFPELNGFGKTKTLALAELESKIAHELSHGGKCCIPDVIDFDDHINSLNLVQKLLKKF
jgi:hypothetical protein